VCVVRSNNQPAWPAIVGVNAVDTRTEVQALEVPSADGSQFGFGWIQNTELEILTADLCSRWALHPSQYFIENCLTIQTFESF
jgi:hypothetical protein